jgi:hypothetical protein
MASPKAFGTICHRQLAVKSYQDEAISNLTVIPFLERPSYTTLQSQFLNLFKRATLDMEDQYLNIRRAERSCLSVTGLRRKDMALLQSNGDVMIRLTGTSMSLDFFRRIWMTISEDIWKGSALIVACHWSVHWRCCLAGKPDAIFDGISCRCQHESLGTILNPSLCL